MTLPELIEWQWSDYAEKHRHRTNLLIHIVAVPLFWLATVQAVGAVFLVLLGVPGGFSMLVYAGLLAGGSLFLQGRGHRLEGVAPEPFRDPRDFARRILTEQYVTFPRFVMTGGWLENLRRNPAQTQGG